MKGLLQNKQEAEDLLEALKKAKVSIPGSSKAIDAFLENVKRGKGLIDGLHLDEEAEKFIVKVRTQQATVADLSSFSKYLFLIILLSSKSLPITSL